MGAREDIISIYRDILWWLKTNCTDLEVNPSFDWGETKTLMYECYQFQDLLEFITKTEGWTPTLLMERGYIMEVVFDINHQVLEISNLVFGKPHKVRIQFDTEFGRVYLFYYSNDYTSDTRWDIHFDY